jgi:hypothetical protein
MQTKMQVTTICKVDPNQDVELSFGDAPTTSCHR